MNIANRTSPGNRAKAITPNHLRLPDAQQPTFSTAAIEQELPLGAGKQPSFQLLKPNGPVTERTDCSPSGQRQQESREASIVNLPLARNDSNDSCSGRRRSNRGKSNLQGRGPHPKTADAAAPAEIAETAPSPTKSALIWN